MKLKTYLIACGPPLVVIGLIAIFNPAILTWPLVFALAILFGGFAAIATRIVEPHDGD